MKRASYSRSLESWLLNMKLNSWLSFKAVSLNFCRASASSEREKLYFSTKHAILTV
ncbi:MAG: hypothetical protein QXK12_08210 [Candidatus Nezhaarchaeales archaeon]